MRKESGRRINATKGRGQEFGIGKFTTIKMELVALVSRDNQKMI